MDKKFLEFWGNCFLNAAKGQEQIENLTRLMREGFGAFEQQMDLFQRLYNFDEKVYSAPNGSDSISQTAETYRKSYREFLDLFGLVSKEDYEALAEKCEALREKLAALEKKTSDLKRPADGNETGTSEVVQGFESLMKKQTDQFQELMQSFANIKRTESPAKTGEDDKKELGKRKRQRGRS